MKKNNSTLIVIIIFIISGFIIRAYLLGNIPTFNVKRVSGLEYNGSIKFDNSNSIKKIKLTLPEGFKDTSISYAKTGYYESAGDFITSCHYELMLTKNYDNAANLAKGAANFFKTTYDEVEYNGIKWYHIYAKSSSKHFYFTDYNSNKILYLQYSVIKEECANLAPEIIKGISF